jgi:uncharacterized protein
MGYRKKLKHLFFGKYLNPQLPAKPANWQETGFYNGQTRLKGLYHKTGNAKGVIVMVHPMVNVGKYFFHERGHADMFVRNGYHVLTFDMNGFGESDNDYFDFPGDILAAAKHAGELFPGLPIGFFGISLGANNGIIALTDANHPFRAAVIENSITANTDYYKVRNRSLYYFLKTGRFLFPKTFRPYQFHLYMPDIKNVKKILLIYGKQDEISPPRHGRILQAKSAVEAELFINDSEHGRANLTEPDVYEQQVIGFFDACLVQ